MKHYIRFSNDNLDYLQMAKTFIVSSQLYHPSFLQCGMMAFREYQRRLWDPKCSLKLGDEIKEWNSHIFGPVGIFLFDLRGNRINGAGVQSSESSLLSDEQWSDLEMFFNNPGFCFVKIFNQ